MKHDGMSVSPEMIERTITAVLLACTGGYINPCDSRAKTTDSHKHIR